MTDPRPDSPDFEFCSDGGKPKVKTYVTTSKYRTGDSVYVVAGSAREGPYQIATVPYARTYTLCLANGQAAKSGAEISEDSLGCVRDVREIARYLSKSLARVQIQLFIADDDSPTSASEYTGVPEVLATYSNVKSGLEKIVTLSKRGTYVYIHYSGHGVRMEGSSSYSSKTNGDLALNVMENSGSNHTRPFSGLDLAQSLKEMVARGAIVTLVLDCCFSGSLLRDHGGYTVITACGPHEVAMELKFPGQTYRHGALSYFILKAVAKLGGLGGKHAHIYPYLCSMFRQYRPTQNPMWYGNPDLCFFGEETLSTELANAPFAVIWNGTCFQLQGGEAHGLCERDESMMIGPGQVLDIAERLAKFELVTNLSNKSEETPFGGCYRVSLVNAKGELFKAGSVVNVKERDTLKLIVENRGAATLYVHVYNLAPLGDIKNTLKATYAVIPPRQVEDGFTGEWSHKIRTVVPSLLSERGELSCEDTVKLFITNLPTSFAFLEMQKLDDSPDRGPVEPNISGLTPSSGKEEWVALDFKIRTQKIV
ncbi:hypothetical protein F5Y16DRAFT_414440 [Xylariaceae sp. FL0255]|nr:hypothetical protein F5Y16DRAFT_414440 [Xylariaceae sp. FL0255]